MPTPLAPDRRRLLPTIALVALGVASAALAAPPPPSFAAALAPQGLTPGMTESTLQATLKSAGIAYKTPTVHPPAQRYYQFARADGWGSRVYLDDHANVTSLFYASPAKDEPTIDATIANYSTLYGPPTVVTKYGVEHHCWSNATVELEVSKGLSDLSGELALFYATELWTSPARACGTAEPSLD
jgi:hypothetical protein